MTSIRPGQSMSWKEQVFLMICILSVYGKIVHMCYTNVCTQACTHAHQASSRWHRFDEREAASVWVLNEGGVSGLLKVPLSVLSTQPKAPAGCRKDNSFPLCPSVCLQNVTGTNSLSVTTGGTASEWILMSSTLEIVTRCSSSSAGHH